MSARSTSDSANDTCQRILSNEPRIRRREENGHDTESKQPVASKHWFDR